MSDREEGWYPVLALTPASGWTKDAARLSCLYWDGAAWQVPTDYVRREELSNIIVGGRIEWPIGADGPESRRWPMADGTKIEWAEASVNPIRARNRETGKVGWFCIHASDGCAHCYSETMNRRLGTGIDYRAQDQAKVELFLDEKTLTQPLHWKRGRRIFWNSMSDTFAEFVPDEWIDRMFAVCALTPQHQHLFLTKRAERMRNYLTVNKFQLQCRWGAAMRQIDLQDAHKNNIPFPLPQIWLGVSVEDQRHADERIPLLLQTPAAVRWISAEPLLDPLDLREYLCGCEENGIDMSRPVGQKVGACIGWTPPLDWVVCGGESGPAARPMRLAWARAIRDQCVAAEVPFFFKQWGEWIDADERRAHGFYSPLDHPMTFNEAAGLAHGQGLRFEYQSDGTTMIRAGKRDAGRTLDGREWNEYPEPCHG